MKGDRAPTAAAAAAAAASGARRASLRDSGLHAAAARGSAAWAAAKGSPSEAVEVAAVVAKKDTGQWATCIRVPLAQRGAAVAWACLLPHSLLWHELADSSRRPRREAPKTPRDAVWLVLNFQGAKFASWLLMEWIVTS